MGLIALVLYWLLEVYFFVLIGRFIVDLVLSLNPSWRPKGLLVVIVESIYTVTDPPLKAIRKFIPALRLGPVQIDLAWTVLFVAVVFALRDSLAQATGSSLTGDLLALGIGNGRQAGGGQVLCPEAMVNDGLLDVAILPAPQEVVGALRDLLGGDGLFVRARLPWVEIKSSQGLDINLDGEPLQAANLRFQARPAALHLHLPVGSPLLSHPG